MKSNNHVRDELVNYLPYIRKIVYRVTKNMDLVDDISQECFIRILEKEALWDARKGTLHVWMNTLSRRVAINSLLKKKDKPLADFDMHLIEDKPLHSPFTEENVRWLLKNFQSLSEIQRQILDFRYQKNMKTKEIAEILKVSERKVLYQEKQAIKLLKGRAGLEKLLRTLFFPFKWRWWNLATDLILMNWVTEVLSVVVVLSAVAVGTGFVIEKIFDREGRGTWPSIAALPVSTGKTNSATREIFQRGFVVFSSNRGVGGNYEIFLKDLEHPGRKLVQLTSESTENSLRQARHAQISPDGAYIAYVSGLKKDVGAELKIMSLKDRRIVNSFDFGMMVAYPSWSHDGRSIVVTRYKKWGELGLSIIKLGEDLEKREIVKVTPLGDSKTLAPVDAVFSNDDRYLYFQSYGPGEIYRINVDGTGLVRLEGNNYMIKNAANLSLSTDGKTLMFSLAENLNGVSEKKMMYFEISTGIVAPVDSAKGAQWGNYATHGTVNDYTFQSFVPPDKNNDCYLVSGGKKIKLNLEDSHNRFNDRGFHWWIPKIIH